MKKQKTSLLYVDTELDEKKAKQNSRRSGPGDSSLEGARGNGLTGGSNRTPRKPEAHSNSRRDKTR